MRRSLAALALALCGGLAPLGTSAIAIETMAQATVPWSPLRVEGRAALPRVDPDHVEMRGVRGAVVLAEAASRARRRHPKPLPHEAAPRSAPAEPEPLELTPLADAREQGLKPGDGFRECTLCPEMVVVPAGSFLMGSPESEPGRQPSEGPQHRVTIARPFAVAKLAVTAAQWQACARERGCRDDADDGWGAQSAVTGPSWNDAQSYVTWLSKRTGKPYRLLSEAEYEYAARAGAQTAYAWGETAGTGHADCAGCGRRSSTNHPAPVGTFAPNGFGLYDMTGNEQSFVEDCWHESYEGAPADGTAWTRGGDCGTRVVRGGSWASNPDELRAASRSISGTSDRYPIIGFRVARTLEP